MQSKDETGKAFMDYWKPSVGLLADKDFISRLKSYDKDNIPQKYVESMLISLSQLNANLHGLSSDHDESASWGRTAEVNMCDLGNSCVLHDCM